jgi:hypothetical protein
VSENDQIPGWAIELIRQVERLNEKIPTHIDWVERNIKDHEERLRKLEQFRWLLLGVAIASGGVGATLANILGA